MTDTKGERQVPNGGSDGSVGMRLNQTPAAEGPARGGQKDLASSPAKKKAAARAIEQYIEPDTRKAGDWADTETGAAVHEFSDGWLTSGALKKAPKTWGQQVHALLNRLSSEKAALRSANNTLQGTDGAVGAKTRSLSALDGF
ncbi:hypothetical protein ACIRF8_05975 [Streptomyces sp. NPDC102406]|uniref:hypothetical protein n=1 Tax=Streptomyces sp. NPDC102406 TaxID=3366171 RepID=UPI003803151F